MDLSKQTYAGNGQKLYEDWMDYKAKTSRPPSTLSKESFGSMKKKTHFFLSDHYANESQMNSTRSSTKVKADEKLKNQTKTEENKKYDNKQAIKEIKSEFAVYYKWVTNGKHDDMSQDCIKNMLFTK